MDAWSFKKRIRHAARVRSLEKRVPKSEPDPSYDHRPNQARSKAAGIDALRYSGFGKDQSQGNKERQIDQTLRGPIMTRHRLQGCLQLRKSILRAGQCRIYQYRDRGGEDKPRR